MDYPAFTAGGLLCEFEHGMRAMKSALRLARGAGTKDLDIGGLHREALEQNNQQRAGAEDKARTAVLFRRPSKAFEDAVAGGGIGLRVLGLRGATPYDGGVPIFVDGKLIGAVGVSGMLPHQDGQVANAAASALK